MDTCVFGPVPSRRLGRSLGVDCVPFKTCPYDCIYCQLGATTEKSITRRSFVPVDDVLNELAGKLETNPDYITLAGSGEPTLYAELGLLIERIKQRTTIPIAVLTNGALLSCPDVRQALLPADLVIPSLDAGDEATFQRVNRPHTGVTFEAMIEGIRAFRAAFNGALWLEVFLIRGLTDNDEQVRKIAELARAIGPDQVQLNTVTRPPTEPGTEAVPRQEMERFARFFGGNAEVIAQYGQPSHAPDATAHQHDVLEMLRRRPCTLEDICAGLQIHRAEALKYVNALLEAGAVRPENVGTQTYYRPA